MDQLTPDWLTTEFLTQCLGKEEGKQNILVTRYTVTAVAPPGNNYGSFIVRVGVEYKNGVDDSEPHSIFLILKSEVTQGPVKEMYDNLGELQKCEYDFYYKFIPKAEKFTQTKSFAPKHFYSPLNSVTILEDLKEIGFVMADRTKQLDFDHCRLYMEAAAAMHAASFAVHKQDPELIESMGKEKIFSDKLSGRGVFVKMIKAGMAMFVETTEKVERFKKYASVIREVEPLLWESIVEVHKPSDIINTINQGDPWTTNMMFKYNEMGNVSEVKIIDFQCLRYGSPLNDLVFLLWTSANNYVRAHKLKELYQIYLDTFNNKLKELQCTERLTLKQLEDSVRKLSPLTIFLVASMLPLLTHPDPVDFGKFNSKDNEKSEEIVLNYYKHFYSDEYCQEQVPLLLLQLEDAGVFEDLERLIIKFRNSNPMLLGK